MAGVRASPLPLPVRGEAPRKSHPIASVSRLSVRRIGLSFGGCDGDAATNLVKTLTIPPDAALNPIGGKLVLEAGDTIQAQASAAGDLELSLSVLEIA